MPRWRCTRGTRRPARAQPAQRPVQTWQPGRPEYLQFLVDSRHVYLKLEEIVNRTPEFATFRASGLERSEALTADIAWFAEQGVPTPAVAQQGASYAELLESMASAGQYERFVCPYNFYFAHTAGGRMIGSGWPTSSSTAAPSSSGGAPRRGQGPCPAFATRSTRW